MSYYVREEDGTSKYVLEDGSGFLVIDEIPNDAIVTQVATEVLRERPPGAAVVTQAVTEVLRERPPTNAAITQVIVEVLIPYHAGHPRFWAQIL